MSAEEEKLVWKGRSHQIVNFGPLVVSLLLIILICVASYFWSGWLGFATVIPLFYAGWLSLGTKLMVFEFTSERMRIYEGILNQKINEVELYRVKATLSSTGYGNVASRCIDDDLSNLCHSREHETAPWLSVEISSALVIISPGLDP